VDIYQSSSMTYDLHALDFAFKSKISKGKIYEEEDGLDCENVKILWKEKIEDVTKGIK